VGYENSDNGTIEFHCLSVLIHRQFAILPAHCLLNIPNSDATFILFGDWQAQQNYTEGDCLSVILFNGFITGKLGFKKNNYENLKKKNLR